MTRKNRVTKRPMSERLPALMIQAEQKQQLIDYANHTGDSLSNVVRTAVHFFFATKL